METAINITLPEDFHTLCSIYQIKPEVFVQNFIDQVSFPSFYSNPAGSNRWATFCFLNFLDLEESKYEVNEDLESQYLNLFSDAIRYNHDVNPEDMVKSVKVGREIMKQWLKAVLTERTKYITDSL